MTIDPITHPTGSILPTKRQVIVQRFNRWLWPKLLRPVSWVFFNTSLHTDAHKTDLMNGLRTACWTFISGHDLGY
ncbi:MAG: hypothetical protein IPO08_22880, partial [Xanthomonadales bacterium]|nr:hypothetical protein [Xanthomonadales bacterium]